MSEFNRGRNELEVLRKRSQNVAAHDPNESLYNCFGHALNRMTRAEIEALRVRVAVGSGEDHAFIEILDGHLALRKVLGMG